MLTFYLTPCNCLGALLTNGSFEQIPGAGIGQGRLPADFVQAGNIFPGADTYSNDGSYGMAPGAYGNFIGAAAQDGLRFAAAAEFGTGGPNEAFGQELAAPLTAGALYEFSAYIRDSFRAGTTRGGFELMLSPTSHFNDPNVISLGQLSATTGVNDWVRRTVLFEAPTDASTRRFLILAPYSISSIEAYIGIDNMNLTVVFLPPTLVSIDIKPYSDWNSINLASNGNIPVAILSTDAFDATTVDPATIALAGAGVLERGNNGDLMASFEDVNSDALDDLLVHIDIQGLVLNEDDVEAQLTGETFDGLPIFGTDAIRLVGKSGEPPPSAFSGEITPMLAARTVPEPSTLALVAMGATGVLAGVRRRRHG
jgi:hypothetical protein